MILQSKLHTQKKKRSYAVTLRLADNYSTYLLANGFGNEWKLKDKWLLDI